MSGYQVDTVRWAKMSLAEQMGNIGSEVGRTFSALKHKDKVAAQHAMIRAVDLFDATATSAKTYPRRKEILRSREEFLRCYTAGKDSGIEKYFMNFSIAARAKK